MVIRAFGMIRAYLLNMKATLQANGTWVPCKLIAGTWYPMPRYFYTESECLAFIAGKV